MSLTPRGGPICSCSLLGDTLRRQQRWEEAESLLLEATRTYHPPPIVGLRPLLPEMRNRLIVLYEKWDSAAPGRGHAEQADYWRRHLNDP